MKKWPIVTLAVLIINSSLPLLAVETATARSIATNGTTEAVSSLVTDLSAIEETTTKRLESDMASSNRPDSQQLADTTETASSLDSTTESSTSSETTTASESSENEATRPQTVSAKPDINAAETNEEAPFVARTIPTAEKNPKEGSYANGNWGGYGSGGTRFTYYFDTRELVIDAGYVPSMHPQAVPWLGHHDVKKITFNGPLTYDKTSILNRLLTGFFKDLQDVTTINGLQYFDMSNVTAMNEMFKNCYHLKKLDLSSWDTQNVSFFNDMFNGCLELADLQIANFDISLGSQFQNMFNHCDLLTDLDISNWKGVFPKTIFVDKMFSSLKNLNSISLPSGEQLEINADLPFIAPNEVYTGKYSSTAKPTLVYSRTQLLGSHTREAGVYVANKQLYGVRVTYTDENDHSIRSSQTILGYYHDPYDATTPEYQLTLPGYTLVGIPKNTTGILDNSVKSVDYIYRKFVTPVVETNDSVMYAGQTYDAKVNFVKGTDHLGNALAWNNPGLTVGGDTVDTQTPGVYHKTLTYKFEKAETVTSSYTVTVKADQTAANLQDVKLYVDDKFDANAPLKKVVDQDGQAINAQDVYKYFIDGVETKKLNTNKPGEHTVRVQLKKANGAIIDSAKPDAVVRVHEDKTSIVAKKVTLYVGDNYDPADGFVSATNADGESLPFSSEMSWVANNAMIDTSVAGDYVVIYGLPNHNGDIVKTITEVIVKDPADEIDVTIPTAMLFANTENNGVAKQIESRDYQITNNSFEKGVNVELAAFNFEETNGLSFLKTDDEDPMAESNSLRLNLKAEGSAVIQSLNETTKNVSIGTIKPEETLTIAFDGDYFGSTQEGVKTTISQEMVLKFNLIRE